MVSPHQPFRKYNRIKGMEITINDQNKNVTDNLSVQHLLDLEIPDKQKGIAVAVNDSVVPKQDWAGRKLCENDKVLIIKATQGG